jgi:hypothetical protein
MSQFFWPPGDSGISSSGPVQFVKNGVITQVSQDTTTPANSIPLPVINLNPNGTTVDPSTATNQVTEIAAINTLLKPASTLAAVTAVGSITNALPAGTNVIGKFGIDQTTPGTTNGVQINSAIPAGANVIGKVSIDQTTPGTTNKVNIGTDGTVALNAGSNVVGKFGIDQTTPGTTNLVALASNQSVNNTQINGIAVSTGNGISGTGVQRVTIASDSTYAPKAGGKSIGNAPYRNDYSSVNVTTAAYVTAVASLTSACTEIEIFDSSGQTMKLAVGAAASEVDQVFIFPGGNGRIPLAIAAGTRISIRAVSGTANLGEIDINFYA